MARLLGILWCLTVFGPAYAAVRLYGPEFWGPYALLGGLGAALSAALYVVRPAKSELYTVLLLSAPVWVVALGVYLNGSLDHAPAELRAVEFTGCVRSSFKNGSTCHVRELADGGETRVLGPMVPRIGGVPVTGDRLTLHVRGGRFGWSWIEKAVNDSAIADRAAAR